MSKRREIGTNESATLDNGTRITNLDPDGMRRVREVAQWFLGDPSWGEMMVEAYFGRTARSDEAHDGINS